MKKKVVHTRLSEEVFDKLVGAAKKHGTTVSSLLRDSVEDFFDISNEVIDLTADKIRKQAFTKKDEQKLVGYQPLTLAKSQKCHATGKPIKKGAKVYLAFFEHENEGKIVSAAWIRQQSTKK